jgi:uncharacterized protein YndB with AHSA1/START domain
MTAIKVKPVAEVEVQLMRIFNAPRELVFRTWTEPKHLAQWWGPRGFTNPVCKLDLRVGGAILIHMCGPDGTIYPMTGMFREIVVPARLVFTAVAEDLDGSPLIDALVTATFEEQDGRTKLVVHEKAIGLAPIAAQMLAGMKTGWAQSLVRLETLVSQVDP